MTTIYYKAVRPNGRDFHTGAVDYASLSLTGEKLPKLPGGEVCGPGVYHASDAPSETLIGGTWPCRLFVVSGKPVAQEGHKFGFRTLRVLGELEAWQAFGPNGREVAALIDRAGRLTREESEALAAAWAAPDAAWADAVDAARDAARDAAWDAAWAAARAVARAVGALIVRDLISAEQFDTLYGPWRDAVESGTS